MTTSSITSVITPAPTVVPAGGPTVRGTVVVVPGRGEGPRTYQRFAHRLAADAYEVRIAARPGPAATPDEVAGALRAVLDGSPAAPVVAVGADTGALAVAAAAGALGVDAVVLAGVPGGPLAAGWDAELDARSACPVHRRVLSDDPDVERGALAEPVPAALRHAALTAPAALPHLVLVGSHDPLAAGPELDALLARVPSVQVVTVQGAHHDVLNDVQHRSVAAAVVTFLERLRQPDPARPIVDATERRGPVASRLFHVPEAALSADTAQTAGMTRAEAISGATVGSERIWMGRTTVAPGASSGDHHHGASETAIHVVAGHPEFVFLDGGVERRLRTAPGDYVYVPPWVPHREENPHPDEPAVVVIARTTQEAIVVNLPGLDAPGTAAWHRDAPGAER